MELLEFILRAFQMGQALQYLTDEHGERTAVVLSITDYEGLLENLDDLATIAQPNGRQHSEGVFPGAGAKRHETHGKRPPAGNLARAV
jgi:hypothetical protein